MRTIQKELGEGDEGARRDRGARQGDRRGAACPRKSRRRARKELKRLERMPEAAGEYSMVRTYLEWLIELPWAIDAGAADRHRRGAPHPRRGPLRPREDQAPHPRIPRGAQAQSRRAAARSCASSARPASARPRSARASRKATGRKFVRVSLGGVHDEAEIRGHRRTYIGALPGNIIQSMRKVGHAQLRDDARRGRQARRGRLPRRPVVGAARGARSRAELDLPRQLPRGAVRPVAA